MKTGLVESFFTDQKITSIIPSLPNASMYQKYVDDGLIDADLMSDNQDTDDQIIDMMTDIVYTDTRNNGSYNPKEYDSQGNWVFDQETKDRVNWNRYPGKFPVSYSLGALTKNAAVYYTMCYGRYWPQPASTLLALGATAVFKATMEPWKFKKRRHDTGH